MAKFEFSGVDELIEEVEKLSAPNIGVGLDDVFSPDYLRRKTFFTAIDELFHAAGVEKRGDSWHVEDSDAFDCFISAHTEFNSWDEFVADATADFSSD